MQYSIYINQEKSLEWKLSYSEAILCSFYSQNHDWVKTRIADKDGDFLCIAIAKLIKELPLIGSTKPPFSRALNNLVQKEILEKIVDEDNSRIVFYRMNSVYKLVWKYHYALLSCDLNTRKLVITNTNEQLQNILKDNSITKNIEVLPNSNEVLPNSNEVLPNSNEVLPNSNLSYNIISYYHNHINNNHNNQDEDDSSKYVSNILKTEFDRLLEVYPQTVNNTNKSIAFAYKAFSNLKATNRVDLYKAVKNYSKTIQVQDHIKNNTTNFIKSLHGFITKGYTEFIYGLPENYEYAEEFEGKNLSSGAKNPNEPESVTVMTKEGAIDIAPLILKFKKAKELIASGDEYMELFESKQQEVLKNQMGRDVIEEYSEMQLVNILFDFMEVA